MIYATYNNSFFGEIELDEDDHPRAIIHKWFVRDGYQNLPHTIVDGKLISISRYILQQNNIEIPKDHVIEYIDKNTLNNKKSNLKISKYTSLYNT